MRSEIGQLRNLRILYLNDKKYMLRNRTITKFTKFTKFTGDSFNNNSNEYYSM